jgi:hypothetical protein
METIVRRAEFCSERLEWVADSSRPDDYPSIVSNPGEVAVHGLVYAAEVNISQLVKAAFFNADGLAR